jgi:hypothetical protein
VFNKPSVGHYQNLGQNQCFQLIVNSYGDNVSTNDTKLLLKSNRRTGKASGKKNPLIGGGYLEPVQQRGDCWEGKPNPCV